MENTDPKPYLYYFNGDANTLVNIFFSKVKPIEGIVKYKMVNWENFPKSSEDAKKLSLEWVENFKSNVQYSGLKTSIFFHLEKKTIRFELKKDNTQIININEDSNPVESIESYDYTDSNCVLFSYIQTNFFDNLNLDQCKDLGKSISNKLESKYSNKKFVVFLNPTNKSIKITVK